MRRSATYTPRSNWTNRLTVGYDLSQQNNRNLRPFGFIRANSGILSDSRHRFSNLTFDYVGSLNFDVTGDVRSSFSWGGQSVTQVIDQTQAYGDNFPGPGDPTVSFPADGRGERAAFDLLVSTVESVANGKPIPLSGVKDEMRKESPNFSERQYGYSGFLQFVKAARANGLIGFRVVLAPVRPFM